MTRRRGQRQGLESGTAIPRADIGRRVIEYTTCSIVMLRLTKIKYDPLSAE